MLYIRTKSLHLPTNIPKNLKWKTSYNVIEKQKKADIDIEIKSAYENVYEIIGIYQKTFILNLKDLNYR